MYDMIGITGGIMPIIQITLPDEVVSHLTSNPSGEPRSSYARSLIIAALQQRGVKLSDAATAPMYSGAKPKQVQDAQ